MQFLSKMSSGVLLAIFVGGCVSNTSAKFDQVQRAVADHGGGQISWNTSSADDARAEAAVARLLARDLTTETAVQIALLNNRDLQANFEEMGIAQADLVRAGLLKNPVFNGAYEFASGGGIAKVNLSVTEDFLSVLQIPMRKRIAGQALEEANLQAVDATLKLAAQVREAFYEYTAARATVDLRTTAAAARAASADAADRLHRAGNLSDLDLANEQAMQGQSTLELAAAQQDAEQKREDLNELMGLPADQADAWKSTATLPDVPADQPPTKNLQEFALQQRLDLAAARRQAEQAAGELGIARQFALLPDASVGPSAEREHEGFWETGPSVSVPIPLFDFGGAAVAGARARLRQAQRRYQVMAVQVQSEVRRAQSKQQIASQMALCYRQTILPSRQQIADQTMLRYDGMLASVFQLLAAKDAQLDAQSGAINAARDYWVATAELERSVGGKLP